VIIRSVIGYCLARTDWTEESDNLALSDLNTNAPDNSALVVPFLETIGLESVRHVQPSITHDKPDSTPWGSLLFFSHFLVSESVIVFSDELLQMSKLSLQLRQV